MDSGQKTYDDTIRDQMDLGYVATRPRFSRRRRTWTVNVRNLLLEDIRALDVFANETVACGAQAFYYPNLVPNWSFELPAEWPTEIVAGWMAQIANLCTVAPSAQAAEGIQALQVKSRAVNLAPATSLSAQIVASEMFEVVPGEVYQGAFQLASTLTGFAGDTIAAAVNLNLLLQMSDGSQVTVAPAVSHAVAATAGYAQVAQTFAIPAPSGGLTITGARAAMVATLTNNGAADIALSADGTGNYFAVSFDAVGVALTAAAPGCSIYGRMVGSAKFPFPVRFAPSKNPQFSDLGFGDAVKRYGTTFDLEEV